MDEERLNCGNGTPEEPGLLPETAMEVTMEASQEPAEEVSAAQTNPGDSVGTEDAQPQVTLNEVLESLSEEKSEAEGALVAEETPPEGEPVKTRKLKWWYIAIPAALVIVTAAVLVFGPFFVYLAPKVVLGRALSNTGEALAARNEGTPLTMMSKVYDETGRNTVELSMDCKMKSGFFSEKMSMDITYMLDGKARQGLVTVNVGVSGQEVDMGLYFDSEKMALNLEQFTGEAYLGIVYDTFGEDARKNEFLYDAIGEEALQEMEAAVDLIDVVLSMEPVTTEQMEASIQAYGQAMLDFVDQKDAEVSKTDISLDGKDQNCYAITFHISEKEVGELYEKLIDVAEEDPVAEYYYMSYNMGAEASDWEDFLEERRNDAKKLQDDGEGECEIVFYLYEDQVAMIQVDYISNDKDDFEYSVSLNFGENPEESDIIFRAEIPEGEDAGYGVLTLSTQKDGDEINEQLVIVTGSDDGEDEEVTLGYDWNRESGEFTLFAKSGDPEDDPDRFEIQGTLTEQENGYAISFPNIMEMLTDAFVDGMDVELDMSLDISVATGAEIEVPEITDITDLTEEDWYEMASQLLGM